MKLAILSGGTGLEREVALRSVKTFIDNAKHYFDYYILPEEIDRFLDKYTDYDIVIPVFHGEYGEDGVIFGLLKSLNIKHVFSPFKTHAVCMDKCMTNAIVKEIGIPVPKEATLEKEEEIDKIDFGFPMIVKPNSGGSSFATYKVNSQEELESAIKNVIEITHDLVLVQEFIVGTEYSVPVIGNTELEVLPIMRVALKTGEFFDYEEKYTSDGSNEIFGDVEPSLQETLEMQAKKIYKHLGCRGISRIDFIVNPNGCYFLEVNTIPGFTEASIFPKAWKLTGRSIEELVEKIIKLGME